MYTRILVHSLCAIGRHSSELTTVAACLGMKVCRVRIVPGGLVHGPFCAANKGRVDRRVEGVQESVVDFLL